MRTAAIVAAIAAVQDVQGLKYSSGASMNPIRKVVSLLQNMQTKVTAEGEKDQELFDKFMCYCKTSGSTLQESIVAAGDKINALTSEIKAAEEGGANVKAQVEKAQADRAAAKAALKEGAAVREKEAAAFAAEKAEEGANIAAIKKAVDALTKGMGGFLQTSAAASLRVLLEKNVDMNEMDRQTLTSFLEGSQSSGYAPASGEIVGILKQMGDTMGASLAESEAAEKAALEAYDKMVAAKKKEIDSLTATIEAKLAAKADAAVKLVQMKNDLSDTQEDLGADQQFIADLAKGCDTKKAEYEAVVKTRSEELAALADTVKILNDDDALELFKKTLPSASSSLLQVRESTEATKSRALAAMHKGQGQKRDRVRMDLIALALRGNKIGFGKVIEMIDAMVGTLKKEQGDDDHKIEYCSEQFDRGEDKAKELQRAVAAADASVQTTSDAIESVAQEIEALQAGIKDLDAKVAEATEQRKAEHAAFEETMSSDSAAKELLGFAKNRLNKFYAPKLYKPAPKTELSAEDRIFVSEGGSITTAPPTGIAGTGISAFAQDKSAPPPAPAAFGAYAKKSGEHTGVLAMMDLLVKDLEKEMTEASTEEKDAQADYEVLMQHSAEKRALDSKAITEKANAKAGLEEDFVAAKSAGADAKAELSATAVFLGELHGECDWLMKYADARKSARNDEISNLQNARAVLSGADYSL